MKVRKANDHEYVREVGTFNPTNRDEVLTGDDSIHIRDLEVFLLQLNEWKNLADAFRDRNVVPDDLCRNFYEYVTQGEIGKARREYNMMKLRNVQTGQEWEVERVEYSGALITLVLPDEGKVTCNTKNLDVWNEKENRWEECEQIGQDSQPTPTLPPPPKRFTLIKNYTSGFWELTTPNTRRTYILSQATDDWVSVVYLIGRAMGDYYGHGSAPIPESTREVVGIKQLIGGW